MRSIRTRKRLVAALAFVTPFAFAAPALAGPAAPAMTYPAPSWEKLDDPEAAGWSLKGIEAFRERLALTQTGGLLAVHAGRVLLEHGDVRKANRVASVRKSLLSMLYGNAVAGGAIRLDATLRDLGIDDNEGLSDTEKEATVRDLLSARSGVYHPAANTGDDAKSAPARGTRPHGTYFLYNNWDFNALGTIYEKATGRNLYDAFESELARPLGMQDFERGAQAKTGNLARSRHPAYHLELSTRDLARLGYFMLREGSWAGKQLVPRDWVKESTRVVTPAADMNPERRRKGPLGYGYLWWVWDTPWATGPYRGAFTAHGLRGQHLTVLPALDLVVAHETPRDATKAMTHAEFWQLLDVLVHARCAAAPCGKGG